MRSQFAGTSLLITLLQSTKHMCHRIGVLSALFVTVLAAAQTHPAKKKVVHAAAKPATTPPLKVPQPASDAAPTSKGKYFVELLSVSPKEMSSGICEDLPEGDNRALSATEVAQLIGNPDPFSVEARGSRQLVVYSTSLLSADQKDANDSDHKKLASLEASATKLANLRKFEIELTVPHGGSFVELGSKLNARNYDGLTVEDVGPDAIRVSGDSAPDCKVWDEFLTDVRHIAWRVHPVSPVERVFYLNGSDVSAALNGGGGSQDSGGDGHGSGPNITVNAVGAQTSGNGGGGDGGGGSNGGAGKGAAGSGGGQKGNSTQNNGQNTGGQKSGNGQGGGSKSGNKTSGAGTGAGTGSTTANSKGNGSADGSQPQSDGNSGSGTQNGNGNQASLGGGSGSSTPSQSPVGTAFSATPDLLVFSEPTPGDDSAVEEKQRIVAMLDLPRPEMIVNVWSMQVSTSKPNEAAIASETVRNAVSEFNDRLQQGILRGWDIVKTKAASPKDFYDEAFYRYVAYHHIGDAPEARQSPDKPTNKDASEDFLNYRNGVKLDGQTREKWGICPAGQYCLGYTELFHPVKPRLTDLLLIVIGAADDKAMAVVNEAIDAMEGGAAGLRPPYQNGCEEADLDEYKKRPGMFFECFREVANLYLRPPKESENAVPIHLLRSAVANFLFNYKMAFEFPHEFSSYDLSQSAQGLNTALSPFVDAFNHDIRASQTGLSRILVRDKAYFDAPHRNWGGDEAKSFTNSAVVSVRTVSGNETIVDTATQSYIDVTSAPTLQQLMSSISQASSGMPGVIGNNLGAGAATALVGALNSMQRTSAKIGRGLKVDLMPRSLPGASAAEINVILNVDETGEPTLYASGQASNATDELSRVAKHDTQTKMRVDSLRIFEVSSLSAQLSRSRTRFPLLPLPGLEVPYIGSLVGIPRRPAVENHSSIAVLSAMVVPTAADLAYGTRFESDLIVQSDKRGTQCSADSKSQADCVFRRPRSLQDFAGNIQAFHRTMVGCLATHMKAPLTPWGDRPSAEDCTTLTFAEIPSAAR